MRDEDDASPPGPDELKQDVKSPGEDGVTLPHWREPPTGEIPRVVSDLVGDDAPRWGESHIGEFQPEDSQDLTEPIAVPPSVLPSRARRLMGSRSRGALQSPAHARRSKLVSSATGVVLALIVLGAFYLGDSTAEAVVVIAVVVAAGEAFSMFFRAGVKPATLVGLIGVVGVVLGAYFGGVSVIAPVVAATLVVATTWYLVGVIKAPIGPGVTATLFVVLWLGVLGSYGSLILRNGDFGSGGLGLLVGVLLCASAADIFAYFGGSIFGKHRLAPRVSPSKSVEGLVIGAVGAVLVGALLVARIHPFTETTALALGLIAAIITPLGDLVESAMKREVRVKDSSRLLPGHGGMLDRIDGIVFVMPFAYYLFLAVHIH
ncbi:MAG: phosphatidate cytidylyltransferase [Ferrimicrobium sp.]